MLMELFVLFRNCCPWHGCELGWVNTIWHYGAPTCIEDYFQESGRGGRSGEQAKSVVFWRPSDVLLRKNQSVAANAELATVRRYVENTAECRRVQLLCYFDPMLIKTLPCRDPLL